MCLVEDLLFHARYLTETDRQLHDAQQQGQQDHFVQRLTQFAQRSKIQFHWGLQVQKRLLCFEGICVQLIFNVEPQDRSDSDALMSLLTEEFDFERDFQTQNLELKIYIGLEGGWVLRS